MEFKNYLLKHELVWSRIRCLERKFFGCRADMIHYMAFNKIESFEYKRVRKKYADKKRVICDEIRRLDISEKITKKDDNQLRYLSPQEIFIISNNGDQMGKVFSYNGEIYRGLYENAVNDFISIWNRGVLQVLGKNWIIPKITISNYYTDEFPLVLHIKKIYIQKNTLWSYAMVKDACILIAFINDLLHEFDMTLLDGHLNNVTFDNGKPIFIDIGSIIPYRATAVQEELVFSGIFRLLFGYLGNCMLYRLPSHDNNNNNIFIKPRFYNQMTREYRFCLKKFKRYHLLHGNHRSRKIVHKIFDLYNVAPEDIDVLFPVKKEYNELQIDFPMLDEFKEKTIIDVGGGFNIIKSIIKKGNPFRIIKFVDFNESRLDSAFEKIKNSEIKSVFALFNYIYAQEDATLNLFKSDIVMCVNPLEDKASFQEINIDTIAYSLNRLGMEYVLVIFNKKNQENNRNKCKLKESLHKYYSIETFSLENKTYLYWLGKRK